MRSFGKKNQQFYLKRKFSVSSDPKKHNGIKLLNHLRLHFSHLDKHISRHNFRATIDPMCSCALEPETILHWLLRWNPYSDLKTELLNNICPLNPTLKNVSHEKYLNILTNEKIIKSAIKFFKTTERFIGTLF